MISPKLVAYTREQLAAGVPQGALRQSLISNGWPEQDIADAFATVLPKAPLAQVIAQPSFAGQKLLLSVGLIIVSIVYIVWQNLGGGQSVIFQSSGIPTTPSQSYQDANSTLQQTLSQVSTPPTPIPTSTPTPTPVPTPTPTPVPVPTPAPKPTGFYANGSYTGSTADAYYGTVQVKAIISGGKIADVQFLQYPSDRSTSRYINGQAMPMLTQEAIQAQSANVDGVSGATATSGAFIQSLASALAKAKN